MLTKPFFFIDFPTSRISRSALRQHSRDNVHHRTGECISLSATSGALEQCQKKQMYHVLSLALMHPERQNTVPHDYILQRWYEIAITSPSHSDSLNFCGVTILLASGRRRQPQSTPSEDFCPCDESWHKFFLLNDFPNKKDCFALLFAPAHVRPRTSFAPISGYCRLGTTSHWGGVVDPRTAGHNSNRQENLFVRAATKEWGRENKGTSFHWDNKWAVVSARGT